MIRIITLDDSSDDTNIIRGFLEQFQKERNITFELKSYYNQMDLLDNYDRNCDVLFMDIEMPGMNGIEVARDIRKLDETVGIVFVTNMAQYALNGYEVNAIDFMIKPITYFNFAIKLERALRYSKQRCEKYLCLSNQNGVLKLLISDIFYIEKSKNYLVFHTAKGEIKQRGTLQEIKDNDEMNMFSECALGYLANLQHIIQIKKDSVLVGEKTLPLSRRLKKVFTEDYIKYIRGTK